MLKLDKIPSLEKMIDISEIVHSFDEPVSFWLRAVMIRFFTEFYFVP